MPTTTTNLPVLRINYLTSQQYQDALENNLIDENQLYLTPSSGQSEGSTISIDRILTTGTAIATIEVDDVEYTLMAPTPPTTTSDLTNDSNFVSDANYIHTDNNFTTTLKNKLDGIAAGATVDDHKWNDVSLNKSLQTFLADTWIPQLSSNNSTEAKLVPATVTPDGYKLAKYNNGYLISTTPTAGDNSTKVATTAFVSSAISALGSVLNYKGTKATTSALPATGNTVGDVWHVTADSGEYAWDGSTWQELGSTIDLSGYVPTTRTVNSKALSTNITLTASDIGALPDNTSIPSKTSDLTNDSGFITTSDIPEGAAASTTTPKMDGTATVGTELAFARGDHIHPSDTSKQAKITASGLLKGDGSGGVTAATAGTDYQAAGNYKTTQSAKTDPTAGSTGATSFIASITQNTNGEITATKEPVTFPVTSVNNKTGAVSLTASDVGALPSNTSIPSATSDLTNDSGFITSASVPTATSTSPKMDGTATVGTETTWAKGDHIHPTDTSRQPKITASGILKGDGNGGITAAVAGTDYPTIIIRDWSVA